MKLKLNQNLRTPFGLKLKDDIIEIPSDRDGVALDPFWRRIVKDSAIDGSIEIINDKSKNKIKE